MDDLGKAYAYAKKCATDRSGKTPHYVKLQAKSWIKIADGKDPDAYVDMDQYHKICRILKIMNQGAWCNFSSLGEAKYTIGLLIYIALLVFFAYFYTSITFNPIEIANNMKKQGGFIPGIRPGRPTSDYLNKVLNSIIFIGAVGLTIAAVLPIIFNGLFGASVSFGGTSLIIVVGVILETLKQIETMMLERHYTGFLND